MPVQTISTIAELSSILSRDTKVVFIDAKAKWCGPCKAIAPFIHTLAESELSEYVDFYVVDVDDAEDVAAYLHVSAMPTFIVYKHGKKIGEASGANKKTIIDLLSKATGLDITYDN